MVYTKSPRIKCILLFHACTYPRHRKQNHLPVKAWETSWCLVIYTTWVIIVMCQQRQSEERNFPPGQTIPPVSYTFIFSPLLSRKKPHGQKAVFLTFGRSSAGKPCTKKRSPMPHTLVFARVVYSPVHPNTLNFYCFINKHHSYIVVAP